MKQKRTVSLKTLNAEIQAEIAIVLLAIMPALSICYVLTVISNPGHLAPGMIFLIFILTLGVAFSGFLILRKYPKNIIKLRNYFTEIAQKTPPENIRLVQAGDSDDIRYIEENFNRMLAEMRHRIEKTEEQLQVEHELRKTIDDQQKELQGMIRTLAAVCHHIGQPATVLQMEMHLLMQKATDDEVIQRIAESAQEVDRISTILQKLQRSSTFMSTPFSGSEDPLKD
ncbi:sensor histidine kinase [Tichowtungia aerotolerans]|uniref:HAMP domain-containing protein n=1 Tax=Tichowtungia aerotolerans TaxID=2697043 RepID=A0A6P1MA93_9BACT|nr:hypothetical protein [Tichowtungia aerotolerans]QHI69474.1 hypothetical protein GT409_08405 [Tichowtungia aerotolerans]